MQTELSKAKLAAKRVRTRLSEIGVSISHTQALETVSSVLSGMDWNRFSAQTSTLVVPSTPLSLLLSAPGDGGWSMLRFYDLPRLAADNHQGAIWVFPDYLDSAFFPNGLDAHILMTPSELKLISGQGEDVFRQRCGGKIIMLHAERRASSQEDCLSETMNAIASLKSSGLLKSCLNVSFLDVHRWTASKSGVLDCLNAIKSLEAPLRFQSQIHSDVELLATVFSLEVLCASDYMENKFLSDAVWRNRDLNYPVAAKIISTNGALDVAMISTLEGCVNCLRRLGERQVDPVDLRKRSSEFALFERYVNDETRIVRSRRENV